MLACVALTFLTMGYFLLIVVLAVVMFLVVGFQYLFFGRALARVMQEAKEEEARAAAAEERQTLDVEFNKKAPGDDAEG
ncbi:MAG: hypothetical protein JSS27_07585 [Planctomycetes bacterium]|nr:hypothetical protein [Planctomycetota bacterium]